MHAIATAPTGQPPIKGQSYGGPLTRSLGRIGGPRIKLLDRDTNEKNDINDSDNEKIIDNAIKAEHNPSSIENKNSSELSPFQAQQETFQLINTVQQLSETVKTLGPVLQEGKKVLDLYKHFKF